jgi:Skp family chaperone for outer membrane proteins
MRTIILAVLCACIAPFWALQAQTTPETSTTQTQQGGQRQASVLVLDQDRLFDTSLFGQRAEFEFQIALRQLNEENLQIAADLSAEEQRLTDLRDTYPVEEFRLLTREFNDNVQLIRARQNAKTLDLQAQRDAVRARFFDAIIPILGQMIEDQNADAILDARGILLWGDHADITELARVRVDEALGQGGPDPMIQLNDDLGP